MITRSKRNLFEISLADSLAVFSLPPRLNLIACVCIFCPRTSSKERRAITGQLVFAIFFSLPL